MEDLVPILLHYIKSREKPGGYVLWVGHNARVFDVPFIINELRRCSTQIPPNWLFVDTLPLARQLMKSEGDGPAHRAMEDVNTLSSILPRLTSDLKLTLSGLVEKSFREEDIINSKKKKNSN
ncbi:DNA polymerase III polC-type [Trifolium medium]|uniref:DNA polymerase III polC-type n=1 Tax=Trifolium medium TaxID=97028 RepID=A0A392N4N5_9FABA|nr:DNA polymerase III polC-type [Trifolium medium]